MQYSQVVVGFDAREAWLDFRKSWSQYELDTFLLRQDIKKPLTTERLVWPSLFASGVKVISPNGGIKTGSVSDLEIPIEYRTFEYLWGNLEEMTHYLVDVDKQKEQPYWIIAVAKLLSEEDTEVQKAPPQRFNFPEIEPSWTFLGFDIAQENLTSGLTGAGYSSNEIETAKARYVPYLNEYHLFTDENQANLFADWADERDPGKAPYFVYALYRIEAR